MDAKARSFLEGTLPADDVKFCLHILPAQSILSIDDLLKLNKDDLTGAFIQAHSFENKFPRTLFRTALN